MTYLKLTERIPKNICLALSGGVDSMVGLDFCIKMKRNVTALHFNHGTKDSKKYEDFLLRECARLDIKLIVGRITSPIPKGRSKEDFWREERYNFFKRCRSDLPVITCHHLGDAVETWVFSSMKGNPKIIPYKRDYILRPFLLNNKERILEWAEASSINFISDKTNLDLSFDRNFIRHEMMPYVKRINPGIEKTIKKKILSSIKENNS